MTLRRSLATSLSLTVSLLALGCGGDEPAAHGEHAGHANHAGHGAQPHGDDDGDSNEHSGHEGHDGHEGHEPLPALAGADQRK